MRIFGVLLAVAGVWLCLSTLMQFLGAALIVSGAVFMGTGEIVALTERQNALLKKLLDKAS